MPWYPASSPAEYLADPQGYRVEPTLTGDGSRVKEMADVPFPRPARPDR